MRWKFIPNNQSLPLILALVLGALFVISRTLFLTQTVEFFADMGRDLLVVQRAVGAGKPPLLGPSTSALPVNQSAWYFYLLFPAFLATTGSEYTTIITGILLYCGVGILAWLLSKKNTDMRKSLLVLFTLILLHPQFITQTRSPWNPSLAMPFLFLAMLSFFSLHKASTFKITLLFGFSLSLAVAFTFSVVPIAIILLLATLLTVRMTEQRVQVIGSFLTGLLLWFLPTIAFELRHDFLLTRSLYAALGTTQQTFGLLHESTWLFKFLFGTFDRTFLALAAVATTTCLAYNTFHTWRSTSTSDSNFRASLSIFLIATCLTLFAPFGIENHYVLGLTLLLFFCISFLRNRVLLACLAILALIWLHPSQTQQYTQPARRNIASLRACARQVCSSATKPMYLTVQAWHSYHYAPEYLFLFTKHGCTVADVTQSEHAYNTMAVIADQSTYTHGQDSFHELSLFGASRVEKVIECPGKIRLTILKK